MLLSNPCATSMKLCSQVCSAIGEFPPIVRFILTIFLGESGLPGMLFLVLPDLSERFLLTLTGFSVEVGFWTQDKSVSSNVWIVTGVGSCNR